MRDAGLGLVLNAVLALVAGLVRDAAFVLAAVLEQETRRLKQDARAAQDTKQRMRFRSPGGAPCWSPAVCLLDAVLALDAVLVLHAVLVLDALLVRGLDAVPVPDAVFVLVLCAVVLLDAVLVLDAALVLDAVLELVLDTVLVGC